MALVMLPCDLPWWPAVIKQLDKAAAARNTKELLDIMLKLHDMCNISLDPDEDNHDSDLFDAFERFLEDDLTAAERKQVFLKTIPKIVERAKALRSCKPPLGLHFSLQQQGDTVDYNYGFVSSLIANAFFSTYPKRTAKTHPTLRDFNFTHFFRNLHLNSQKAKLRCIFNYFDYLEKENALEGKITISRQVMTSKQWLTIEDWLECSVPLCPLSIRHEGRLDRIEAETKVLHVCFSSSRLGGGVLEEQFSQETIYLCTHPELLSAMLSVEALEDNEVLIVEGARHFSRINDPRNRTSFEAISQPCTVTVCCMDAEDYSHLPISQFEEDNILREMNKSLLGFRQRHIPSSPTDPVRTESDSEASLSARRLSPIGESFSSTPPEIDQELKPPTVNSTGSQTNETIFNETCEGTKEIRTRGNGASNPGLTNATLNCPNRKNRFIVLGSSGEILPVTRKSIGQMSVYSSCNSQSTDSFHSAKDTIDEDAEDDEQKLFKRFTQMDSSERKGTFAQRLKEALKRESSATCTSSNNSSTESSYAVGISVTGSHVGDQNIKLRRGGSRGFVLRDETVDEEFLKVSLEAEQKWLGRFRQSQPAMFQKKDSSASSRYSFSTEYSSDFCSELEEVYEQLSKWLEEPGEADENREMDPRDQAVVRFAGSLLKRALSESFAGVPVQEGEPQPLIDSTDAHQRHKLALAVRSLSLELARQKNKRQQSMPRENSPLGGGLLSVATGNWGCGSHLKGDPQLKLVIQWLAASLAGVPKLIYYTSGHQSLSKLDTVSRILMDRHWTVGNLAAATLRFAIQTIEERLESRNSLFEDLIGMDKPSP
ncbi:uncharacterized protein LOC122510220 isoform X2 [Leptopilina heterotoma]|uniref:uncharacterized protein LOC122510220 isoform X2 n=1 Tax=Leptopilina heterotoma TaxID=63436 RepID=UPI001CA884F9|nr:uncharacterized protein LOC122510220 isoform X2 [Leptopilina heterotoma]